MNLITDPKELLQNYLSVATYLFERGEMVKAYQFLYTCPSIIEEEPSVLMLKRAVRERLEQIHALHTTGQIQGKYNVGMKDPENIDNFTKYQELVRFLQDHNIKYIVDVGCYTGWLGRRLSTLGIKVHGIDIHPVLVFFAAISAGSCGATFEYLPAEKLGLAHPVEFDAAVLLDVIEHTSDPYTTIRSVEKSVKKDGWVIYCIPHPVAENASPRFEDSEQREHLYSFSLAFLQELFQARKNLKIQELTNEENQPMWMVRYQV